MRISNKTAWIILLAISLSVGGFFYFVMLNPGVAEPRVDLVTGELLDLPQGIKLDPSNNGRFKLINELDKYNIEIDKPESIKYDSGKLDVIYSSINDARVEGGGYVPSFNIITYESSQNLESWIKDWISSQSEPEFYSYDSKLTSGGATYFRIIDNVYFGGPKYSVVFKKGNQIFFIDGAFFDIEKIMNDISL